MIYPPEVETLRDLFLGLVDGVVDLLKIGASETTSNDGTAFHFDLLPEVNV